MRTLSELLSLVPVRTHEEYGIPNDAREALTWAVIVNETLHGNPANVPQVTETTRRVALGKITPTCRRSPSRSRIPWGLGQRT
jgi:anhydro-N-acetylmuramic acid kinase